MESIAPLFTWRSAIASAESGLTPTQRLVALVLSLHMSELGDSCFPSLLRLMDETGLDRRSVQRALKTLSERDWIERTVSHTKGKTNHYRATVPLHIHLSRAVENRAAHDRPKENRAAQSPKWGGTVPPEFFNELYKNKGNFSHTMICGQCGLWNGNHVAGCLNAQT